MTKTGKRNDYYAGQESANTLERNIIGKTLDIIKNAFDETIIEEMKKASKRGDNLFNIPSAKSQKTDIAVNGEVNLSIKPEYQNIMNLFIGRKFSLKNYSQSTDFGVRVSLGSTDPLKAFIGVLTSFNESQDVATKAYYASLASYVRSQKNNDENIIQSLNSSIFALRYYYELTGVGLKIDGTDVGEVDFLIVNNPKGRVAVRSTKDLIYKLLSKENDIYRKTNNPFREIHAYIKFDT